LVPVAICSATTMAASPPARSTRTAACLRVLTRARRRHRLESRTHRWRQPPRMQAIHSEEARWAGLHLSA
jgi:hypothetical protein